MVATTLIAMFLAAAVWTDLAEKRIPNWLTVSAAIAGFGVSLAPGGIGPAGAAGGLAVGFATFLPLYLLRAAGAGDVKLMAASGTFLGVSATFAALLYALVLGGLFAVGYAAKRRSLRRLRESLRFFAWGSALRLAGGRAPSADDMPLSGLRAPYAIAIAGGVLLELLSQRPGGALA